MTRHGANLHLFLDRDLRFSSLDEYRYHEALVHPAMAAHEHLVLLLGAGDGLVEILRWPQRGRSTWWGWTWSFAWQATATTATSQSRQSQDQR